MFPKTKRGRGFTMIELLVIVVIIAVLASVAITGYYRMQDEARIGVAKAELNELRGELAQFHQEKGVYPVGVRLIEDDVLRLKGRITFHNDSLFYYLRPGIIRDLNYRRIDDSATYTPYEMEAICLNKHATRLLAMLERVYEYERSQ